MKKYEVLVDDENAKQLTELLQSLSFVKDIKQTELTTDIYTLVSEQSLAPDWTNSDDEELQSLYQK